MAVDPARSDQTAILKPLRPKDPAWRQAAHDDADQCHLAAAGHADDGVGPDLRERVLRARIQLDAITLSEIEIGHPVNPGVAKGVEYVGPRATDHGVVALVAGNEIGTGAAAHDIVVLPASDRVVAVTTMAGVGSKVAVDQVIASIAVQQVAVSAAHHPVITRSAAGCVISLVALEVVEACPAGQTVGALTAGNHAADRAEPAVVGVVFRAEVDSAFHDSSIDEGVSALIQDRFAVYGAVVLNEISFSISRTIFII